MNFNLSENFFMRQQQFESKAAEWLSDQALFNENKTRLSETLSLKKKKKKKKKKKNRHQRDAAGTLQVGRDAGAPQTLTRCR